MRFSSFQWYIHVVAHGDKSIVNSQLQTLKEWGENNDTADNMKSRKAAEVDFRADETDVAKRSNRDTLIKS